MQLAKAAMLIRKELLHRNNALIVHLIPAISEHVNMILEGPSVMNKSEQDTMGVNAGVVLSQLLIFTAVKRHRDPQADGTAKRQDRNREPPLPV